MRILGRADQAAICRAAKIAARIWEAATGLA